MSYLEDIVGDEDTIALEVELLKLRIQEAILKRLEHEKTVDREEAVLITHNAVKELIRDFVPARCVTIKHNIQ